MTSYILARDHLQRAVSLLNGKDPRSRQLRHIIQQTVHLLDELDDPNGSGSNVLDFAVLSRMVAKRR